MQAFIDSKLNMSGGQQQTLPAANSQVNQSQ